MSSAMQTQKVIELLGYKRNEAKVYLTALSLGEAHVSDIATKVKLPRSSVQVILEKLHRDGLVNFYIRKRYKYWVPENPEKILAKLKEREEEVRTAIPRLQALRRRELTKPQVRVFEGVEEIKLIHEDIIETKQHVAAIIPWDNWTELVGVRFREDFIERRVRHFLRIRLLVPDTETTRAIRAKDAGVMRETRFIPAQLPIHSTLFIYGTKIAIISLNMKFPTAVLIDDVTVHDTMITFFNELWGKSVRQ